MYVLLAGVGSFVNPAASNTGSSSRTRPGIEPSTKRLKKEIVRAGEAKSDDPHLTYNPFLVAIFEADAGKLASVGKYVAA